MKSRERVFCALLSGPKDTLQISEAAQISVRQAGVRASELVREGRAARIGSRYDPNRHRTLAVYAVNPCAMPPAEERGELYFEDELLHFMHGAPYRVPVPMGARLVELMEN